MTFAEELAARLLAAHHWPASSIRRSSVPPVIALYMGLEIVARMRGGDSTGSMR